VKLLLVEDDDKLAVAVRRSLKSAGFTVDRAADGDEGWRMLSESGYDLVVLDLLLPGRSGMSLCREMRAAGDWTPVLMLTAKGGEHVQASALDTGVDDYLTKPFSTLVLIARIRALLRRVGNATPATSTVGRIAIDSTSRRAWSSGVEVTLTSREFDLLEYLVRRPGEAVSKQEILDDVWQFDFDGDPNIVEVYVARLRRKLDKPFGTRHLVTLRGAGYRIEATDVA
jgi:DNA-binding response OmpR family regulator